MQASCRCRKLPSPCLCLFKAVLEFSRLQKQIKKQIISTANRTRVATTNKSIVNFFFYFYYNDYVGLAS